MAGYHPGIMCDRSGMDPIVGPRYSLKTEEYDLCEAEYGKLSESEKAEYVKIEPTEQGSPPPAALGILAMVPCLVCFRPAKNKQALASDAARAKALALGRPLFASNEEIATRIGHQPPTQGGNPGSPSIFKPYSGNDSDGWKGDGKVFKPYSGNDWDGWKWDGKVFKPYSGNDSDGWKWDGKVFKPYSGNDRDGWEGKGGYLPPPLMLLRAVILR